MPDVNHMQIGTTNRAGSMVWGAGLQVRNLTVYDRALSPEEVQNRSYLFERSELEKKLPEGAEITDKRMFLKLVKMGSQIQMVLIAIVFQPSLRQTREL